MMRVAIGTYSRSVSSASLRQNFIMLASVAWVERSETRVSLRSTQAT